MGRLGCRFSAWFCFSVLPAVLLVRCKIFSVLNLWVILDSNVSLYKKSLNHN
jgi:hypothetical protein